MVDDPSGGTGRISGWSAAVQSVATKSAMTPIQWLAGIAGLAFAPLVPLTTGAIQAVSLTALISCLIVSFGIYLYWLIKDPDRLQSEDYRLENRRIDLLGDDQHREDPRVINAEPVANTHIETQTLSLKGVSE